VNGMTNAFDLSGLGAVVTGGNGGIGLAIAEGLAAAGARVLVLGRNAAKTEAAARGLGEGHAGLACDVLDAGQCRAAVAEAVRLFGRLDVLVNNAGINIRAPAERVGIEQWDAVIGTNLTATHLMCQAAFRALSKPGGKVINIGSMMSIFGAPYAPAYAASKGGVVQYTKALATGWAAHGIQVNAILPGWIDTELTQGARREVDGLHERVLARTPAGRWGRPADLAGTAVFLAARASDFVTGTAIPVDGGYSVQG
jgi:2-dehydro-3-deoxy-D-gluconate 5-dehydrogenase